MPRAPRPPSAREPRVSVGVHLSRSLTRLRCAPRLRTAVVVSFSVPFGVRGRAVAAAGERGAARRARRGGRRADEVCAVVASAAVDAGPRTREAVTCASLSNARVRLTSGCATRQATEHDSKHGRGGWVLFGWRAAAIWPRTALLEQERGRCSSGLGWALSRRLLYVALKSRRLCFEFLFMFRLFFRGHRSWPSTQAK